MAVGHQGRPHYWASSLPTTKLDWPTFIEHVAEVLDRYRAGEVDGYTIDETIHHYHRADPELWKFCWSGGVGANIGTVARTLEQLTEARKQVINGSTSPPENYLVAFRLQPAQGFRCGVDPACSAASRSTVPTNRCAVVDRKIHSSTAQVGLRSSA